MWLQGPVGRRAGEERNEIQDAAPLIRGDLRGSQHAGKKPGRGRYRGDKKQHGQRAWGDGDDEQHAGYKRRQRDQPRLTRGLGGVWWARRNVYLFPQCAVGGAAAAHEHRCGEESGVVAVFLRQPPIEHGAKERADIDAEVENLEGPVARAGLGGKSGAQNRNRGGLEQPRAESERQKPDDEPRRAGDEREGKVPAHQQPGAGK